MFTDWLIVAAVTLVVAVAAMLTVGAVIRKSGRVGVIDVLWGPLILVSSLAAAVTGTVLGTAEAPVWLLLAMVAVWAGRLSRHLGTRFGHDVEDPRYTDLMDKPAANLLRSVLLPQGGVAWLVSIPLQVASIAGSAEPGGTGDTLWWIVISGLVVAVVGLVVETIADRQLDAFRQEGGHGRVMDRGLWSWSRHPNYFGESVIWWGIWIAVAGTGPGSVAILCALISPVAMTVTLVWGSGARILEKRMAGRQGWDDYRRRTSKFIPLPPGS